MIVPLLVAIGYSNLSGRDQVRCPYTAALAQGVKAAANIRIDTISTDAVVSSHRTGHGTVRLHGLLDELTGTLVA